MSYANFCIFLQYETAVQEAGRARAAADTAYKTAQNAAQQANKTRDDLKELLDRIKAILNPPPENKTATPADVRQVRRPPPFTLKQQVEYCFLRFRRLLAGCRFRSGRSRSTS